MAANIPWLWPPHSGLQCQHFQFSLFCLPITFSSVFVYQVSPVSLCKRCYLVLAALCLCRCVRTFSSCSERGPLSSCSAWASHCSGFSCCRVWTLGRSDSVVLVHWLGCFMVCGVFPNQESNPCPCIGKWILNHWTTREVLPVP